MRLGSPANEEMQGSVAIHILHEGGALGGGFEPFVGFQEELDSVGTNILTNNGFVQRCATGGKQQPELLRGSSQQRLDAGKGRSVPARQRQRCGSLWIPLRCFLGM